MANAIMLVRGVEDPLAEEGLEVEALLREQRIMRHELLIHVARQSAINR